jgi:hypothetical protein
VIAPGLLGIAVHALLDNGPLAIIGDDEAVQVEAEPVLDGRAVDLGHEPACFCESGSVNPYAVTDGDQLLGGLAGILAAPAANMNSEFVSKRRQTALEGADDARRDPGGVPVHSHDSAERLKPEGIGQSSQQLISPIVMHDGLTHDRAKARHPVGQPFGHMPPVQG